MALLGHRLVENQVRDHAVIHPRTPEQRVQIDFRVGFGELGYELRLGVGKRIDLRTGIFGRPLVALDIQDLVGEFRIRAVPFDFGIREDALRINIAEPGDQALPDTAPLPEIQSLDRLDDLPGRLFREAVIRDHTHAGALPFLHQLLFRLQNREVELGHQVLIGPGRTFLVVISEFRGPRHQEHEDCEDKGQRPEAFRDIRRRYSHNGRFLR